MDPRDSDRTTVSGQTPRRPEPEPARRMDPRWWLVPPVVALGILGAYFLGQRMTPEAPVEAPPANQQPVLQTPPPAPPMGRITVTEVPRTPPKPVTPPPVATPPVVSTPPPAPKTEPFHQVEPPVVLPPPATDSGGDTSTPPSNPPPAAPDNTPSEPDREPRALNDPALEYPSSAYEAGVEGTAKVSFSVSADGKVEDVRVADSSGDSRLDQAAMDYARRLRFRPGIRNGKPADIRVTRNVRFQLH